MGDNETVQTRSGEPPARTSASVSFRRQSTSERLNEILEGGRDRAESMGRDPTELRRQLSSPILADRDVDDVAPDELTGFASRGSGHNYQALQHTGTNRSKRSIYTRVPRPTPEAVAQQQPAQSDTDQQGDGTQGAEAPKSWIHEKLGNFRSIELENKGSVARDHLALERTFLAWLRTSLAFASIGVAVTQLFRLNTSLSDLDDDETNRTLRRLGKPLGSAFLGISILTLLLGFRRYFHGQEWVIKGKFPASRGTIIVLAIVALAIMLVSLVVVIVIHPPDGDL